MYLPQLGKITAGMEIEVNHALAEKKSAYELTDGKIIKVEQAVKEISRMETIRLYDVWRAGKLPTRVYTGTD